MWIDLCSQKLERERFFVIKKVRKIVGMSNFEIFFEKICNFSPVSRHI